MPHKIDQIFEDKPEFETARLKLVPVTNDDFELFHSLFTDKDVMKYSRLSSLISEEDNRKNFKRIRNLQDKGFLFVWKMILKETGVEIGRINIGSIYRVSNKVDMGYVMLPEYWRKGIMTEATSTLISYLFKKVELHKITATTNNDNLASKALLHKLGFVQEGLFKESTYYDDSKTYTDDAVFGLLRNRYKALKNI